MVHRIGYWLVGLILVVGSMVQAQEIKLAGVFLQDSIKIGEPVIYSFTAQYPKSMEALFPDSSHNFGPFEWLDKEVFTTSSDSVFSHDSVIYHLTTFEIDPVLKLGLPIYLIIGGDSTVVNADPDSIYFKALISEVNDTLALKQNTNYQEVEKQFNYPYLIYGAAILVVILAALFVLFGKEVMRRLKIARLKKGHLKFNSNFDQLKAQQPLDVGKVEHMLAVWKEYLEKLDKLPYSKLTTKEILTIEQNQSFGETLKSLDRNIYDQFDAGYSDKLVHGLQQFSDQRFLQKLERLKNV